jgi:hypothetical protein
MVNRVKKMERISGAISGMSKTLLGKSISRAISGAGVKNINAASDAYASPNPIPGYRTGGRVKRTGIARVHKGEVVLTASAAKTLKKLLNK